MPVRIPKNVILVCACTHTKQVHWCTKQNPAGPCRADACECRSFTPEPICACGHGLKVHTKLRRLGYCRMHYIDGCKAFTEARG